MSEDEHSYVACNETTSTYATSPSVITREAPRGKLMLPFKPNKRWSTLQETQKLHICRKCDRSFATRTELMRHVYANACTPPKLSGTGPNLPKTAGMKPDSHSEEHQYPIALHPDSENPPQEANLSFKTHQVIEAQKHQETAHIPRYKYAQMQLKFELNGPITTAAVDTGCSDMLVDEKWLQEHSPNAQIFTPEKPNIMNAVDGQISLTRKARFDFYVTAQVNDAPVEIHFHTEAWVKPELKPNMLIGMNFLDQYNIDPIISKRHLKVGAAHGAIIPIEIMHKTRPIHRRVVIAKNTVVNPYTTTRVPVEHATLQDLDPHGAHRTYHFMSQMEGIVDHVCTLQTPGVTPGTSWVMAVNNTEEPLILRRKQKIGTLSDYDAEDCYHISDTKATAMMEAHQNLSTKGMDKTILNCILGITDKDVDSARHKTLPKATTQKLSTATRPTDIPNRTLKNGIHICEAKKQDADTFQTIALEYDIWRDRGIIPLPKEEKMQIELVEGWQNQKIHIRPYPMGLEDRKFLDTIMDDLHTQGRASWMKQPTPFGCPCFIVWRTVNGQRKGRMVVDMRPLNKITIPDIYPIPSQEEIINSLRHKKYITILDASAFFHQLPIYSKHKDRNILISPRGLEMSHIVIIGFKNSPAFAQRFMDQKLYNFRHFARAYIDDVVIASDTFEEHCTHLHTIFKTFQDLRLAINPKKSFVGYPSVHLLGFQVDAFSLATTEERIKAIANIQMPTNLADLETYLGMATFLRKFVYKFQQKAQPLEARKTQLLADIRKEGQKTDNINKKARHFKLLKVTYDPTPPERESFAILQEHFSKKLKLFHHDPTRPLFLKTDASGRGFGAFLFHVEGDTWDKTIPYQKLQPVMFLSRLLSKSEQRYKPTELELACLVWACRLLKTTIQSSTHSVQVLTDHSAIKGILEHTSARTSDLLKANSRLMVASIHLSQFRLEIHHIPGKTNFVPDALSRLPTTEEKQHNAEQAKTSFKEAHNELDDILIDSYYTTHALKIDEQLKRQILEGYEQDGKYRKIIAQLKDATKRNKGIRLPFFLEDELLYRTEANGAHKLYIPDNCLKLIFTIAHDEQFHGGNHKTLAALEGLAIRRVSKKVKDYIQHCQTCIKNRTTQAKPPGELQPILSPAQPFHTVAMDFIVRLPPTKSQSF